MDSTPRHAYKKNRSPSVPVQHVVIMTVNGIVDEVYIYEVREQARLKANFWATQRIDQSKSAHSLVGAPLDEILLESSTHEVYLYSVPIVKKEN